MAKSLLTLLVSSLTWAGENPGTGPTVYQLGAFIRTDQRVGLSAHLGSLDVSQVITTHYLDLNTEPQDGTYEVLFLQGNSNAVRLGEVNGKETFHAGVQLGSTAVADRFSVVVATSMLGQLLVGLNYGALSPSHSRLASDPHVPELRKLGISLLMHKHLTRSTAAIGTIEAGPYIKGNRGSYYNASARIDYRLGQHFVVNLRGVSERIKVRTLSRTLDPSTPSQESRSEERFSLGASVRF